MKRLSQFSKCAKPLNSNLSKLPLKKKGGSLEKI